MEQARSKLLLPLVALTVINGPVSLNDVTNCSMMFSVLAQLGDTAVSMEPQAMIKFGA